MILDKPNILENSSFIEKIKCRDDLRVGYSPGKIPFAFFNKDGELVGYDIRMAYDLANILNVSPIEFARWIRELGLIELTMAAVT